jgi:methyl-accepting chemotaxis protein
MERLTSVSAQFLLLATLSVAVCMAGLGLSLQRGLDMEFAAKKAEARHLDEAATSMVNSFVQLEASGALTRAEAQKRAIEALQAMVFDGNNYFVAITFDGISLANGNKASIGKNRLDAVDSQGRHMNRTAIDIAKSGHPDFYEYSWPKRGETREQPKIAFSIGVPAWEWAVGTGIYVDDVYATVTAEAERLAIIFTPIFLAFLVVVALLRRAVTRPLVALAAAMRRVASGDLATVVRQDRRRDEVGDLQRSIKQMVGNLGGVVRDVTTNADRVASGATQLSSSAEELSQGATEQAAAAEEACSSMEQMAASIKQNAANASQTEVIASQSARDAEASGEAVNRAVEAMRVIAGKITIVQEIARQTDLLALNAAVEAARAGEHGRGFAVVASEVRKLAERSQMAAQEIGALSGETVTAAQAAGTMLSRLVPDIKRTATLVEEITAACREQDIGSTQINQAIQQLDKVTQQNASASEQVSATAEVLAVQATSLRKAIAYFTIEAPASGADVQVAMLASKAGEMRRVVGASPEKPRSIPSTDQGDGAVDASREDRLRAPGSPFRAGPSKRKALRAG